MSFDFGEVLTRAWQITWKYKFLWVFGLLFFLIGFAPALSIFMAEDVPFWIEQPAYMLAFFGVFLLLIVALFLIGAFTQAAISVGALRAEREAGELTFKGIFKLQFLLYPLMIVAYAWQEQALASIVVDDLSVIEAAKRGWQMFRKHMLPVTFITLILYLGVGMVSGFVSFPMMIPFFVIPFALIEEIENIRTIIIAASLCLVVYMPVLAVVQSGALTFLKTGWMLTYLRLTRSSEADIPVSHLA